jgi:peptidoglycan/xylan/chitin deacetylase (PgdA/CDA1 family)
MQSKKENKMLMIHHIESPVQGSVNLEKIEQALVRGEKLTFDDGLKCQELVFPLLERYKVKATFFVNNRNDMERHRKIRERLGEQFYSVFFQAHDKPDYPETFLSEYDFYTDNDKAYRWVRDFSDPEGHDKVMDWISDQTEVPEFIDPQTVVDNGHELGLHSTTHPRRMDLMKPHLQFDEWVENLAYLHQFQPHIRFASYPMGRYNEVTKEILRQLGIVGAYTSSAFSHGKYELPRIDINQWG